MNERPDEQDPAERDLAERLQRIAGAVGGPVVDPSQDVRRGRARLRRRQTLSAVGSAAAVVGVVGGVAALVNAGGHSTLTPADGSPSVLASVSTPTTTPTPTVASSCATRPSAMTDALKQIQVDPLTNPVIKSAVTSYAQILTSHLDPAGVHLQTVPTGFTGTPQIPCAPGAQLEVGTKLGWGSETGVGEAMVYVSVTNDWADDQIHLGFDQWSPVSPPSGTVRAWTAGGAGTAAVAVKRADGTVVAIETDQTFGNNSQVGVAGFGFTADQLLQAAADPRFALPR